MQQKTQHRGIIVGFLSLSVLVGAALTTSPAQAQNIGVGPYFAPPAWARTLPSAARFMILSNFASAAVLDRETGLVWEKSPDPTSYTWNDSRYQCINKNVWGRKGWRLPSIPELASLIDPNVTPGPTLPLGHPFTGVLPEVYWSETTNYHNPDAAWYVNFYDATVFDIDKTDPTHGWCVRGPMQ